MTTFDKREEGFEKKFAHDEELRFKAMARRNKLLGPWAAGARQERRRGGRLRQGGRDGRLRGSRRRRRLAARSARTWPPRSRHERRRISARQMDRVAGAGGRSRVKTERLSVAALLPRPSPARRRNGFLRLVRRSARRIVAETLAREGFAAVVLDMQHGLWDTASLVAGIGAVHHARRRAGRARAARRFRVRLARARFRRRGDHRADDQQRRGCPRLRRRREISAARRAQLGPAARHGAAGPQPSRPTICARPTTAR